MVLFTRADLAGSPAAGVSGSFLGGRVCARRRAVQAKMATSKARMARKSLGRVTEGLIYAALQSDSRTSWTIDCNSWCFLDTSRTYPPRSIGERKNSRG